jgi:hypothetical protein
MKKPENNTKKSSTPLSKDMPPGCVDKTSQALGAIYGIVGVSASAIKPKDSKQRCDKRRSGII